MRSTFGDFPKIKDSTIGAGGEKNKVNAASRRRGTDGLIEPEHVLFHKRMPE